MDEQLYLAGLGLSLPEKVEKAISTFRHYEPEALKFSPDGYYLCDSYGKDSCVILDLAKRSGVKFTANHSLTTIDPPELIYFGRKHHPNTIVHRPAMAMMTMLATTIMGPPTRLSRWCCEKYKENGGSGMLKVFGVRAAESARRRARWRIFTPDRKTDAFILNPILYWSDDNVWQYIHQNNIPYCCLYGPPWNKKRVGCIGCPMSREGRASDFIYWPRYERAWKRAFKKFWNKWHGVPRNDGGKRWIDKNGLKSWQELWSWWMEEMPKEDKGDECQMGLF